MATLDQVHITGQDTDLQASGTAQVFGATGPNGGKLDVKANGSISMAMAHTLRSGHDLERQGGVSRSARAAR